MSSSNPTPNSVITIATWALAVCLGIIVVTLSIIAIRDGNTPLVSQAMGELLWLGGVAIATLVGLLGFTKYLENGSSAPAAAAPTNALGIAGDIGSILTGLASSASAAPAAAAPAPTADNTPTLTAIPVVSGGQ